MEIPYVVTPRKDTGLFNSKIAIWLFLASEVMLFGGFFSAYIFLRIGASDPVDGYPWPERALPVLPGLINTFVLIASSVTVVFAWASLKMRQWGRFQIYMGITVFCSLIFLALKGVEYNVKFHHQAVRLFDYATVEGHLGYELKEGVHAGHGEDPKDEDFALDLDGNRIEENFHNFETSSVILDLSRYHLPWVETMIAEAGRAGVTITLTETADFNRADAEERDADLVFEAGTALSPELLAAMREVQLEHRARNAAWRTEALRQAWKVVKSENTFDEANFAADFPKGLEMESRERARAYVRWKAIKRARMAEQVAIDQVAYERVRLPEMPTATFGMSAPLLLRHTSHDVISKYDPAASSINLRDSTVLNGGYAASNVGFHYVDAIDFRHVAMRARAVDQDPGAAIEASWLLAENPQIREIWEKHGRALELLEVDLAKKGRVPTDKDRYRIDWKSMAYYAATPLDQIAIEEGAHAMPQVDPTFREEFLGPDYKTREFPHLSVPREQVLLDSKFTPKWNTYYAIYFTMTGLHGLHVIGGAIVLGYYLFFGRAMYLTNPEWLANRVEVGGLFWHFVDLVWIFLFPILYLM